jgi:UDP-N-acetylmuramoyl-tripeptide--D-alanyl-D-alanine ligase
LHRQVSGAIQLNTERRLQDWLRRQFIVPYLFLWARLVLRSRKPFIIGVTGSAGKTTTIEMIAAVLEHETARPIVGAVAHTLRNMNDDTGLPLTVLRYDNWPSSSITARLKQYLLLPLKALKLATAGRYPDVLVLEYGTHSGGHLKRLARLAPPDIAVVTTIGPAHLNELKTLDGVLREKGAVVQAVHPLGLVILGRDHDHVGRLEALAQAPVVKLPGRWLELSAGVARTVARRLEVPDEILDAALETFEPPDRRLTPWRLDHLMVLDDSYNANPLSMKLGIETLDTMAAGKRCLAVLGAMLGLGEEAPRFHRDIGALARRHAHLLIGVGELARWYASDQWYPTSRDCAEDIERLLEAGDCVLVKGSNAIQMECIVQKLKKIGREGIQADNATASIGSLAIMNGEDPRS